MWVDAETADISGGVARVPDRPLPPKLVTTANRAGNRDILKILSH